jgi:hypothetical protein
MDASTFAKVFVPTRKISWARETAFNATVGAAKHSAFLAAPDCHFAATGARELDCSLAREYGSRTPRTRGHAYALFAGYGSSSAQSLALRVPSRTALKVIN